ncbi:hypothetical protein VTK56DRAFT_9360 [Thermocarpiscus australiensis]
MRSSSPPPRKPAWPWSGRTRRNSESSVPTLKNLLTRRNSLSAADASNAAVVRKQAAEFSVPRPGSQEGRTADQDGNPVGSGGAKNNNRKSQSRPPPAFYNRVYHRRTVSAAEVLQWHSLGSHDNALLKSPSLRVRTSSLGGPAPDFVPTAAPTFPWQPWSLADDIPLSMYPTEEQEFVLRTKRASAKTSPSGLKHPDLDQAPVVHMPTAFSGSSTPGMDRAGGYNRPRRLSNNSVSSASSSIASVPDSVDSRIRSASTSSSQTSIESWPTSPGISPGSVPSRMGWQMQGGPAGPHYLWQRPAPIKTHRRKTQRGELFAALPGEVLELILEELRNFHLRPGSSSCATCWMRDCCSAAVSARKFLKYAREALYRDIQLVGQDGPNLKKRTRTAYGSRLVLLRRTLRANPQIAVIVRSLKPPARPPGVGVVEYNDLVASVVMACPNLERLVGFYPTYDHSFQRLFQALSTRRMLKEMNWVIESSPLQRQQGMRHTGYNQRRAPGELQPQESQWFLDFHLDWRQLTTLVVHCQPGATLRPANLLERTIRSLPSLHTLYLSRVPHTAFSDTNLLSLPSLKKLSLSHCSGITNAGLSSMATRPASASIKSLTLLHMNIESLPAIARIFSYLICLETFNIVQTCAPTMPADEFIMLFPYLASRSLRKLHWDIPYLPMSATTADTILARSISAGGFPSLRVLCTPNDPEGIFQALCAPQERIDHPADRYLGGQSHHAGVGAWQGLGHTRNTSSFSSYTGSCLSGVSASINGGAPPASPLSPRFPQPDAVMLPRHNSDLHQARLAAQARLEAAQRFPRYFVNVFDEQGAVVEQHAVGAFLGTVESRIRYVLSPEAGTGGTDEGGGLVSVEDMLRDDGGEALFVLGPEEQAGKEKDGGKRRRKEEREREREQRRGGDGNGAGTRTREGCYGRWNTFSGAVVDKKDKERWWHQERGRWRPVVLS